MRHSLCKVATIFLQSDTAATIYFFAVCFSVATVIPGHAVFISLGNWFDLSFLSLTPFSSGM